MTRRTALLLGFQAPLLRAADFWKTKNAADWSAAEQLKLHKDSPWAKQEGIAGTVRQEKRPKKAMPATTTTKGKSTTPTMTPVEPTSYTMVRALVRWESAKPFFDIAKKEKSKLAQDNYILALIGWPPHEGNRVVIAEGGMAAILKNGTELKRKGKDPIYPSVVQEADTANGLMYLFLFPRAGQPIEEADKEVIFYAKSAQMALQVKFALKDMQYEGKLEL